MHELAWRKSTYSAESGNCVEVAATSPTHLVRDSKNPTAPALAIPTPHWRQFILGV
jgi:predicted secreted Zn-dependent protease